MEKMMYLAAQYLAAAGISFLEKKADDSHTNLGFSIEEGNLYSRPLNDAGATLSVNYERFSLQWNSAETTKELQLDGTKHVEIVKWITERSSEANIAATYNYKFHYELPYEINDDFKFQLLDEKQLEKLMHFRILAQLVLENFVANNNLKSDVRIWPHHFDTGAYISFENGSNKAVGLGLAIPDSLSADHYFYASGYKDQNSIDTSGFSELANGKWHSTQFKGAILPATDIDEAQATEFFEAALESYNSF